MVIFLLPLSWLRFFWWRFNIWGELAAIVLGLPLSILVWFVFDFQRRPLWQGTGLLFLLSGLFLLLVSMMTPPETEETLSRFYARCRPPGFWGRFVSRDGPASAGEPSMARSLADCGLGIITCLGLVVATNTVFSGDWLLFTVALIASLGFGAWLLARVLARPGAEPAPRSGPPSEEYAGSVGH